MKLSRLDSFIPVFLWRCDSNEHCYSYSCHSAVEPAYLSISHQDGYGDAGRPTFGSHIRQHTQAVSSVCDLPSGCPRLGMCDESGQ